MMSDWYYEHDGRPVGPLGKSQLNDMLRTGQISRETSVWTDGMKDWCPASILELDATETSQVKPRYLYISVRRLVLMALLTGGLFESYWMYRNWCYVRDRDHRHIRPFWRTVFAPFYIYDQFAIIRDDPLLRTAKPASLPAGWLAAAWILVRVASGFFQLTDFGFLDRSFVTTVLLVSDLLWMSSFFCVLPIQVYINRANAARMPAPRPSPWTWGQWVVLVVGLALSVAALVLP